VTIQYGVSLAWALALTAKPHLNDVGRSGMFVAIGAGETFTVIRELLKWVAIKRIPLGLDVVQLCVSWLDTYVGHEDERYLRRLVEDFVFPLAIQASASSKEIGLSTTPRHRSQSAALVRVFQSTSDSEFLSWERLLTPSQGDHARI
jgi:hypothetical protein